MTLSTMLELILLDLRSCVTISLLESLSELLTHLIAADRLVQLRLESQHLSAQPVSTVHQLCLKIIKLLSLSRPSENCDNN